MQVITTVFVDATTKKQMENREYLTGDNPTISLMRGDIISFAEQGDDVTRYAVEGREMQEVEPGGFAMIYTIRQVPKAA